MEICPNSAIRSTRGLRTLLSKRVPFFQRKNRKREGGKGDSSAQFVSNHCQISASSSREKKGASAFSSHRVLDGEGGTEKSRVENRVTNCTSTRRVSTGCEQRVPVIQGVPCATLRFCHARLLSNIGAIVPDFIQGIPDLPNHPLIADF